MPDKDSATPRVFLLRHGQTEWSNLGTFTGTSEIPLTDAGKKNVEATASHLIGPGLLIDPAKILRVYNSPRVRAKETLQCLREKFGTAKGTVDRRNTEAVAEWGYGDYEGLLTHEIRALREERGLDKERPWDIWRDGCEGAGSEGPDDVAGRVDGVIREILELHGQYLAGTLPSTIEVGGETVSAEGKRDVLIVAHGHVLRAFVKRWLGMDMSQRFRVMIEPGGVVVLSYEHGKLDERALVAGWAVPGLA
ncbi:hypothetical protein LTR66_013962, partial [Elasticomyces elasticus]